MLFKVLCSNNAFITDSEDYGSIRNHNFFWVKRLTWAIVISLLIHLSVLSIPIPENKKKTVYQPHIKTLDILLAKKTNKPITKSSDLETTNLQSNIKDANKKTESAQIKGIVIGKPVEFGMKSPVNYRAFGRSKRRVKSDVKNQSSIRKRFQTTRQTLPPMEAVWAIIQEAQIFFPGGEDLTCQGALTFVCKPTNIKIANFFEDQWMIMHMNYPNLPPLELDRQSGFWRLHKLLN